jgi:2-methylcitrate dehydratase
MASSTLLEVAGHHAAAVRWDRLTAPEQSSVKWLVADSVGVAIAASESDVVNRLASALDAPGSSRGGDVPLVQVIGRDRRSLDDAVLLNCALVRQLDLMDVFWGEDVCHPSENIPVALSVGEAAAASGRQVLEAVVAAYDIQVGLCRLLSFSSMGLHHVSAGGVAVPLLVARLRGLDVETAVQAAALTVYRSVTLGVLSRGELSHAKSFSYGLTAVDALRAVRLAEAGLTGPAKALDWIVERLGNVAVTPERFASLLTSGVTAVAIKRYPVQFALQGPVEAAARAGSRARADGDIAGNIERIDVKVPAWTIERTADAAKYRPRNRETADHSLPVCVAMAALDGGVTADAMLGGRWSAAEVVSLAQRVRVERDEDLEAANPGGGPGAVDLILRDGTRHGERVEFPLGDPQQPMSDAHLLEKFLGLTSPRLGQRRARVLWEALLALDEVADVTEVMRLTRGGKAAGDCKPRHSSSRRKSAS